jgi:hypothetical protein
LDQAGALQNSQSPVDTEGAVIESASNSRNSAAVPFCSHSKIINASLANYDIPGFKLGQLLEIGSRGNGNGQARYRFIRIEQTGSGAFLSGIARTIAHKTLHGECVTETRQS